MPDKAIRCLAAFISSKIQRKNTISEEDLKMTNYLVDRLLSLNYDQRAYFLMNRYVFAIPLSAQATREQAFKLYHRALVLMKLPWNQLTG